MGKPSERIYIIEADPITGEVDRGRVLVAMSDMIGALFAVGGKCQIAADRVEVGTVMVEDKRVAIAETKGIVIRYQSFAPVRRSDSPAPPLDAPSDDPTPEQLEQQLAAQDARTRAELAGQQLAVTAEDGGLDFKPDPERFPEDKDLLSPAEVEALIEAEAAAARG